MKTLLTKSLTLGMLALCFALSGNAFAGTLYAVREDSNSLVSIDTVSLAVTPIGPLGVGFEFGGLAWNSATSSLYAVDGRGGAQALYTVNTATGAATLVGGHGVTDMFGLEYDPTTNTLYGSQFAGGDGLYSLNMATGAATFIGATGIGGIGGLAYNSAIDALIGVNDGSGNLYTINRATGAGTLLASPGNNNDSGLAYDVDTNQYWDIDWNGNLFSIDATTFARTTQLSGLTAHDGLAYVNSGVVTVPEPATAGLLAAGILPLVGILIRRRTQAK